MFESPTGQPGRRLASAAAYNRRIVSGHDAVDAGVENRMPGGDDFDLAELRLLLWRGWWTRAVPRIADVHLCGAYRRAAAGLICHG
jgi:hypothetical protein